MKKIIVLFYILFAVWESHAQVSIEGILTDKKGKGIAGVNITLKDTYDGGVSDSKGNYHFTTTEKGDQELVFAKDGYDTVIALIKIAQEPIHYNASLKENQSSLDAVVVTSRTFSASNNKRSSVMTPMDIYTLPGANGDISSGLKTLPGVQQSAEKEGLAVHGGDVYETKQFIDGTMVNNPYATGAPNIATRGRYPPALFKNIAFSSGGYSALYGQALSSALVLETVDIPDKSETNFSVFPMFWSLGTQHVAQNKKSSWGANYGYANLSLYNLLIAQTPDFFKIPQFHSADANFRIKTSGGGIVKYFGSYSYNQMGLRRPSVDSLSLNNAFDLKSHNNYHNVSWKQPFANNWKMDVGLSFSNNRDRIQQNLVNAQNQPISNYAPSLDTLNFNYDKTDNLSQIKVVMEKKFIGLNALRFGGEYWYADGKMYYAQGPKNPFDGTLKDHYKAAFAETDLYITYDLALQAGMRYENSSLLSSSNIVPRMALAYKIAKGNSLIASYGIFFQKPEGNYLYYNRQLDMAKATHYILTYAFTHQNLMLHLEGYYKKYNDLVKLTNHYDNSGNGYAKGFDLYWRDQNQSIKSLEYSISYSYVDTKRNYLNFPQSLQPNFVAKNTLNIITKEYISSMSTGFGFSYNYASPRPYYNILRDATTQQFYIKEEGKATAYNSLNFSVYHLTKIAKAFAVIFANTNNILGANNVSGYLFSVNGINKQAILPPAKRSFNIGLMLSWGVDRSQDNINNNL